MRNYSWKHRGNEVINGVVEGGGGGEKGRVLTLYVPIIAILDIWKTTLFYEGESVVYDEFKYVWPVKG